MRRFETDVTEHVASVERVHGRGEAPRGRETSGVEKDGGRETVLSDPQRPSPKRDVVPFPPGPRRSASRRSFPSTP